MPSRASAKHNSLIQGFPGACSLRWARRRRRVADVGLGRHRQAGPGWVSLPCHLLPCWHSVGCRAGGGQVGLRAQHGRGMDAWGSTTLTDVCSSDRAKSGCRWGVGRGGGQELPQGEGSSARKEDRGGKALADALNPSELGTDEGEGGTGAGPAPVPTKCCVSTRAPRAASSPCRVSRQHRAAPA